MNPTLIAFDAVNLSTSTDPQIVNTDAATQIGDLLFVAIHGSVTTLSSPVGWTPIGAVSPVSGSYYAYYKTATVNGSETITFTYGSGNWIGVAVVATIRGSTNALQADQSRANSSATNFNVASTTTTVGYEATILIVFADDGTSQTWTLTPNTLTLEATAFVSGFAQMVAYFGNQAIAGNTPAWNAGKTGSATSGYAIPIAIIMP